MKKTFLITSLMIMLLSCRNNDKSRVKTVSLHLKDDTSLTRTGAEQLTKELAISIAKSFVEKNIETVLKVSTFASSHSNPAIADLKAYKGSNSKYDANYVKNMVEKRRIDSLNQIELTRFSSDFEPKIIKVNRRNTYINRQLLQLAYSLKKQGGDIYDLRIGAISTDFVDDPKRGKPSIVNKEVINELNQAVAEGALLYVITDAEHKILKQLNCIYVDSWTDLKLHINKKIISNSKNK